MFISFLVRLRGYRVIEVYDAQGQYQGKMAAANLENVFSWRVFLAILIPGLVILGRM